MASQSAGIAFPLTYDAEQNGPNYSASDFRLTAGAAMAVPDGSGFGGIQGVRAGSPSPLATIDGTTVTVAAHMGWLCPWTGNGCYTYALPEPQQVTVDSTIGSYKIAVVLEDKAAGHGNGETVYAKKYPGYTLDSQIPGLVVARVDDGVASDVAPVVSLDATVRVRTYAQLQSVAAADGTTGVLADGTRYERQSGVWSIRQPLVGYVSSPESAGGRWEMSFTQVKTEVGDASFALAAGAGGTKGLRVPAAGYYEISGSVNFQNPVNIPISVAIDRGRGAGWQNSGPSFSPEVATLPQHWTTAAVPPSIQYLAPADIVTWRSSTAPSWGGGCFLRARLVRA